jgi:outer membrane lipoprotein-sorting protein
MISRTIAIGATLLVLLFFCGAIIFRLTEEVIAAVDNVLAKASSCLNQ